MPTRRASGGERLHAPAAHRTVVEVLLGELIAPVAEPEVLDLPGQLGGGGGERQELRDPLQLLAGLAVQIDLVRSGLDDLLAAGRWRAHAVLLVQPHARSCYQR